MKLRRGDDRERELAQLDAKLPAAAASLERATEAAARIPKLVEAQAELAADAFLGDVDGAEQDRRRVDLEAQIADLRANRKAARKLLATLRGRAADLAEEIAREIEAKASDALHEREAAVADAQAILAEKERELEAAAELLRAAEYETMWARAPFDDEIGKALAASDQDRARMLAWAVGQATTFAVSQLDERDQEKARARIEALRRGVRERHETTSGRV